MKKEIWIIVLVIAGFLGFMMGYGFPPLVEIGFTPGKGLKAPETRIDKDMQDYYKNLYKDDE